MRNVVSLCQQKERKKQEENGLCLIVDAGPAKGDRYGRIHQPAKLGYKLSRAWFYQSADYCAEQKKVGNSGCKYDDAERKCVHAEHGMQPIKEQVLAPRANVAMSLWHKQDGQEFF